jgi:hypothetical protein
VSLRDAIECFDSSVARHRVSLEFSTAPVLVRRASPIRRWGRADPTLILPG